MNKLPDLRKTDLEYAYDGELGAIYSDDRTEFRVWSPYAEAALVKLVEREIRSQEHRRSGQQPIIHICHLLCVDYITQSGLFLLTLHQKI